MSLGTSWNSRTASVRAEGPKCSPLLTGIHSEQPSLDLNLSRHLLRVATDLYNYELYSFRNFTALHDTDDGGFAQVAAHYAQNDRIEEGRMVYSYGIAGKSLAPRAA